LYSNSETRIKPKKKHFSFPCYERDLRYKDLPHVLYRFRRGIGLPIWFAMLRRSVVRRRRFCEACLFSVQAADNLSATGQNVATSGPLVS
jgi:hypothetical protein